VNAETNTRLFLPVNQFWKDIGAGSFSMKKWGIILLFEETYPLYNEIAWGLVVFVSFICLPVIHFLPLCSNHGLGPWEAHCKLFCCAFASNQ